MTIGVFAERCGLPRSALRFYDECGLLRPVAVDEATGYRYYDAAQVGVAELVRRLRATDMPVERVREFLAAGTSERRRLLMDHVASVEGHLAGLRAAATELLDLIDADEVHPSSCQVSGPVLADAVAQVAFAAAGPGGNRPGLGGVLIEVKAGSLRLVATDSYRLAVRDVRPEAVSGELRALVPAVALRDLVGRARTALVCDLRPGADRGVVLSFDGREELLAGMAAEFPDYEAVLDGRTREHRGLLDRRRLADAVAGTAGGPVTLTVTAGTLTLVGQGGETVVACDWDGPARAVTLDGRFLADAVAAQVGPDIAVEIADPLAPVILRSADTGTVSVWTMPIRTDRP